MSFQELWKEFNSISLNDLDLNIVIPCLAFVVLIFGFVIHPLCTYLTTTEKRTVPGPITQYGLESLSVHVYKSSDYTILDNILNYWWTWAAQWIPLCVAPNVITLLGFFSYIPGLSLIIYFGSFTADERPWWVYVVGYVGLIFYQNLDALDGKHARATGASGPLGQLFDHGIDSMAVCPAAILAVTALRLDGMGLIVILTAMQVSFFIAQWGERYLHVLLASVGQFGVTEGQILGMSLCVAAAHLGGDFWITPVYQFLDLDLGLDGAIPDYSLSAINPDLSLTLLTYINSFAASFAPSCTHLSQIFSSIVSNVTHLVTKLNFASLPISFVVVFFFVLSSILMIVVTIIKVVFAAYREGGSRRVVRALLELMPPFSLAILNFLWFYFSTLSTNPNQVDSISEYANAGGYYFYNTVLTSLFIGFIFSHITSQMIISAMTQQKYSYINQPSIIFLGLVVFYEYLSVFHTSLLIEYGVNIMLWKQILYIATGIVSAYSLFAWSIKVAYQIASLFGIYVLRVGKSTQNPPVLALREKVTEKRAKKDAKKHD